MCGIAGYLDPNNTRSAVEMVALVGGMADSLAHRGPDDGGTWVDSDSGVALGHRRLSIIDLSPAGHQPMVSGSGRFVIVFNGEIYNYLEILQELRGLPGGEIRLRGHSDTEVMLTAFEHWGVEQTLPRLAGMFALVVWDRHERALWLARDRFGKKPLYYGRAGGTFLFASELKAFRANPAFHPKLDLDAVALYLRFNCVPAPQSIYCGVSKLPAASWLRVSSSLEESGPRAYWSLDSLARSGIADPFEGDDAAATEELDRRLKIAVRQRMLASDVPVGLFLSGGVDSSTVTALAQTQSSIPIRTFSIGMSTSQHDESKFARAVAHHLGTDHTEWVLTPSEAVSVIPEMPSVYDEPFADASQVPTLLVSRLARKQVKVVLSGDGGDEMFGGYNRHILAASTWPTVVHIPAALRRPAARALGLMAPEKWEDLMEKAGGRVPSHLRLAYLSDKVHKIARALEARDSRELYLRLLSNFEDSSTLLNSGGGNSQVANELGPWLGDQFPAQSMMLADARLYMHDDILVKVDRASMAVSLEVRNPFLDAGVAEFAWKLPLRFKIRDGAGKWIVRRVMNQYIPPELTEHPKMGFAMPLTQWLRGPLRDWAQSLIDSQQFEDQGVLKVQTVRTLWSEFLAGRTAHTDKIWCLLMLQGWLESQKSPVGQFAHST